MTSLIEKNKLKFSRILRKNSTPWEDKLWGHLKNNNLGVRFKRQLVIGDYILDFSCFSKKLVIELDGSNHKSDRGKENDKNKIAYLKHEGYKILRFWNNEIDSDINLVLSKIIKALN